MKKSWGKNVIRIQLSFRGRPDRLVLDVLSISKVPVSIPTIANNLKI